MEWRATVVRVPYSKHGGGKTMATRKSAKKSTAKKAAKKSSTRKYSPAAGASVEREMKAMKQGKLKSGSGQKVTNPKQAIAIGLSEARKAGKKVPPAREG
jgi:anti-sigma28 factor (negative regulator of flagellin synthesis)